MSSITIEGGVPLIGTVNISGSKNSAIKLIYASLFSNEDVVLDNVPHIGVIEEELDIIKSIGATAKWIGKNTLLLNGSTIETYKVPFKIAQKNRTVFLLTGVLLFRFGKAYIPKIKDTTVPVSSINKFLETWDSFGVIYAEDANYYMLSSENLSATMVNFKLPTHMGTDHALLIATFLTGDSVINNASQDPDVDELISFLNNMGASIKRIEPHKIKVTGTSIFRGLNWRVSFDKNDVVTYVVATLITNGNTLIKGVDRESLTSFSHFLMKIGARFEFTEDSLKVWNSGEQLNGTTATISPYPGLIAEWQPLLTLLLCKSEGESYVYDTIYTNRFDYIKDLNRMGANIDLIKPSDIGKNFITHDDSYNFDKDGEPNTVIKIPGSAKLKAERLDLSDFRFGAVLVLAALAAEGRSHLFSFDIVEKWYEDIFENFKNLGARIKYVTSD